MNSLDLGLQAKLLRVLQEGEVRRVGGSKEQKINVKIIAAMNISPEEALERGIIRSDLFFSPQCRNDPDAFSFRA
ncbi:sigma 54-interacting transcriptional regulator [Peribacillus frigoritolerans]|nr:sigma 54-interacting transcriptional regulator [Peribacillus frigoritolerans]